MIDLENALFDDIFKTVKAAFPDVEVSDEYEPDTATFPVVTVVSRIEGEPPKMIDSSGRMKGVNLFAEINAYASRATGYKTAAKELIALVCDRMKALGFALTMCEPIPNQQSSQVYRYAARFAAVADENNKIYRR